MRLALDRLSLLVLAGLLVPAAAGAQQAARFYEDNCALCHTIGGGDMAGPDLKGSTDRKDREWLVRFLLDPEGVKASGDEYAAQLVARWGGLMPATDGLTRQMAEALVDYIEATSRTGVPASDDALVAFSDEERARGLAIFTGRTRLSGGGPACASCHGLGASDDVSGGMLGPDLAAVHARLGGARGTMAWLAGPPTPMMRAIYRRRALTDDESRALAALFERASATPVAPAPDRRLPVLAAGAALAIASLAVMGVAWRGRFRSVRRRLLAGGRGDTR